MIVHVDKGLLLRGRLKELVTSAAPDADSERRS